jgi:hypothetical protein
MPMWWDIIPQCFVFKNVIFLARYCVLYDEFLIHNLVRSCGLYDKSIIHDPALLVQIMWGETGNLAGSKFWIRDENVYRQSKESMGYLNMEGKIIQHEW